MNAKERAVEIYAQHLALASTDGRSFRKTVMDQLMSETGCSLAAAATHYNNAKKAAPTVEGLGRAAVPKTVRKMPKGKSEDPEVEDNECFTVLEVLIDGSSHTVGRTHSYEGLGLAKIKLGECLTRTPTATWYLIQGLGPNHGDTFKIAAGEKVLEQHSPKVEECSVD
jgi:hypothetical protein